MPEGDSGFQQGKRQRNGGVAAAVASRRGVRLGFGPAPPPLTLAREACAQFYPQSGRPLRWATRADVLEGARLPLVTFRQAHVYRFLRATINSASFMEK